MMRNLNLPENIKIIEIEIENYRQYIGNQLVRFPDRDKGFSVIIGENGAGKSNILNAINWCFYQIEPHDKKNTGKFIINQQYLQNLDNGKTGTMSVKVKIKQDDIEYHISRVLTVTKNEFQYVILTDGKSLEIENIDGYLLPRGTEVQKTQSNFEIMKKEKHESNFFPIVGLPNTKMNEILPEILSSYFLLDGEYLEKFWDDLSRVKIGVEQISQLNLLAMASDHLIDFKTSIPKIGISNIDSLTTEINSLEFWEHSCNKDGNEAFSKERRYNYDSAIDKNEYYHATGSPRIKELEEDIKRMKKRLTEISQAFARSNIKIVTELDEQEQGLMIEFEDLEPKLKDMKRKFIHSQINNGPILFLRNTFQTTVDKVDALRIKGELPYDARVIFTQDLLDMNKCICHTNLTSKLDDEDNETNQFRKNVECARDQNKNDIGLDYALDMTNYFKNLILNDTDQFILEHFEEMEEGYMKIKKQIKSIGNQLGEVRRKLENIGISDIEELIADQKYVLATLTDSIKMIETIKQKINTNHTLIGELRNKQTKFMNQDKRTKKIAFEQDIWLKISGIMDKSLSSLKEEIRLQVQKKTFEIFIESMYKKKVWDRFTIDENYSAELYDSSFMATLSSLSPGEKLFLALSFISALKEITGYKFPLVIDTPLGRVSAKPRFLLSQALPKFLPNEQILFLATDTEFISPLTNWDKDDPNGEGLPEISFAQLLEKSIKINYWSIRHSIETETATIQNYRPSWEIKNGTR